MQVDAGKVRLGEMLDCCAGFLDDFVERAIPHLAPSHAEIVLQELDRDEDYSHEAPVLRLLFSKARECRQAILDEATAAQTHFENRVRAAADDVTSLLTAPHGNIVTFRPRR